MFVTLNREQIVNTDFIHSLLREKNQPDEEKLRFAVLGATGLTGMEIVKQALAGGNEVTAVARNPAKLGEFQSKVRVVQGDVTDPKNVDQAVTGSDAVLGALGHAKGAPPDVLSRSASNIMTSMRDNGVKRVVVLTNIAVKDNGDNPKLYHRFIRLLLKLGRSQMYNDTIEEARIISETGLEWTLVRAIILSNGQLTGKYRLGELDHTAGGRVSRADVASFMIACAVESKYLRARPVIS